MNNRSSFEEEILVEALALPAATRRAFIENRCGAKDDTASRMIALLDGYQDNSAFLETPAAAAALQSSGHIFGPIPPEPEPGDRINRYHLLNRIGEGGFGVVYLAEQEEPVQRLVALKVIRLGLDTREFIARFEGERQALAVMDHPNIARVFDAGSTDSGRPYLVMELIRGIPITAYCDEHRLPVTARLGLFLQVCGAIQHAHQKGVIHCDLKPSNILIEPHDPPEEGCPKVIDFGIAKATPDHRKNKTLFTRFHALIGTPAYTSPEQMELSGLDVDTRSDIYSLGVLLYELLTGQQPFDPNVLEHASLEEMRRLIREVDPPRPSLRVGALESDERMRVAQRRGIEPEKLSPLLRSDLDWIVMRCLEKDRTRRYETANGLAMDLRRHLACEPVIARPPSRSYKIEKFVRRNRTWVIAGGAVAIAVITGLTLASLGFARARVQQRATEMARHEAEDLVSFMVKDLKPELQRAGRLPLSAQVAERAVRYFSALPTDLNNASTERNRAIALEGLAFVRASSGNKESAASLWHEALAARRRAVAGAPHDALIAVEFALTEFVDVAQSPPLVALQAWGTSFPEIDARLSAIVDRARKASRGRMDDPEVSRVFARLLACQCGYFNAHMNRPKEALAVGLEAEALYREFLARTPEDTALVAEFVRFLVTISVAYQQSGDIDGGIKVGQEALAFADRAFEKNPGNIELRENAAFCAAQLTYRVMDSTMERASAAEAVARERWRRLVEIDPQNFSYRHEFATAHSKEVEFLFAAGRVMDAGAVLERLVSLLTPVAQSPDDFLTLQLSEYRMGLVAAQFGHSDTAREHRDRMREWTRKYVASLAPEVARQPGVRTLNLDAELSMATNLADWPEVERQARLLLFAVGEARRVDSHDPNLVLEGVDAEICLGRALFRQGSAEKVIPIMQAAVRDLEDPNLLEDPYARRVLLQQLEGATLVLKDLLAEALLSTGDARQAQTLLETGLTKWDALAKAIPTSCVFEGLANNAVLLASALDPSEAGQAERRLALLERASARLENRKPGNPFTRDEQELLTKINTLRAGESPTLHKVVSVTDVSPVLPESR